MHEVKTEKEDKFFQLVAVLREVRYLNYIEVEEVPDVATALFEKHEMFRKYVANLNLTVSWYNEVVFFMLMLTFFLLLYWN